MWSKLRTLHKNRYDIILLQETKLTQTDTLDDLEYRWKQVSDGEAYTAPALTAQTGGVAILLSAHACSRLTNRQLLHFDSEPHRHIAISATLNNEVISIHSIYAPVHRADRPSFFNSLPPPTHPSNHIIGGDFNCVLDPQLDTQGDHNIAAAGSTELAAWLTSYGAIDGWRQQHENTKEFTSPSGISRIDLICLSGCFKHNFEASHMPRTIGSDHLCPTITTTSSNIKNKGGHWQLPVWLARTAAQRIRPTLQKLAESTDQPGYITRFTNAMRTITGQCMATHKLALRARKNKIDKARLRWIRAHLRASACPTDELIEDADRARMAWIKELEETENKKRAWAFDKHFAHAEKCTRFFLTRARSTGAAIIPGIKLPDGSVSTEQVHIRNAHTTFWTNLYSRNACGTEDPPSQHNIETLTNVSLPRLPSAASQLLETDITEADIVRQIEHLPLRKAAGADGLKGELFRQSPKLWAKVLLPVFQNLLHRDAVLPKSFKESVIILLHKKGCTLQPENYRPIALLNVMAKLLSNVHCARLRRVLTKVIPDEQTGFVPGRSISENIILLGNAIHYDKQHHQTAIILALDFAKAYDRIQWHVMIAILKKIGFGPRFLNIINVMYKNRSAQLSINGDLTPPFPIERGVLQGDPLSPALFILACSPLYVKLNEERNQHGIPLPNDRPAPVATYYADDTTIIARSPSSAVHLYNVAEWFCTNSGARLHRGKCIAIPTGPAPATLDNGIKILHPTQSTTILGVPMGMSITRAQQIERIILKMLEKCNSWAHVGRTIEGRITVARAIILSTLWYVLAALPTNPSETKKIHSIINNYINRKEQTEWGGPTERGNMSNLWFYKPKHLGGWGLTPILRTLRCRKLTLLRGFINDRNKNITKPWHTFAIHMLRLHVKEWCEDWDGIYYWSGTQTQSEFGIGNWNALSPWWRDVWSEWVKLDCQPKRNTVSLPTLRGWPVWNNRILAANHGIQSTLRRSFINSTTRTHMDAIRKEGFKSFKHFMRTDGAIMSGEELYTSVTVSLSVNDRDHIVPRYACNKLIRLITALWKNATTYWLRARANPQQTAEEFVTWWPKTGGKSAFHTARNKATAEMIAAGEPQQPQPRMISLRNTQLRVCWKREQAILAQLAPSRRDLLRRLSRNALPVGSKRTHWNNGAQTLCMLCEEGKLETARHLFWDCSFTKEVWGALTTP